MWLIFQKYVGEVFNIISQQSTARPGCIIELDAITDFVRMRSDREVSYQEKCFDLVPFSSVIVFTAGETDAAPARVWRRSDLGKQGIRRSSAGFWYGENLSEIITAFVLCLFMSSWALVLHSDSSRSIFSARFFLVVLEFSHSGRSILHMWHLHLDADPVIMGL